MEKILLPGTRTMMPQYVGMDVGEARKFRALEENNRMKRTIADQAMQFDILKEVNSKKW